jgi:hypothetical protein
VQSMHFPPSGYKSVYGVPNLPGTPNPWASLTKFIKLIHKHDLQLCDYLTQKYKRVVIGDVLTLVTDDGQKEENWELCGKTTR